MKNHRSTRERAWTPSIASATRQWSMAIRGLRRAPAFSYAVMLTLTIGIGAATAICGVVDAILLRPLPYPGADRLVAVVNDMPPLSATHNPQSIGTYLTFPWYAHTLQHIALYQDGSANIGDAEGRADPVRLNVAHATASLLPTLGVSPSANSSRRMALSREAGMPRRKISRHSVADASDRVQGRASTTASLARDAVARSSNRRLGLEALLRRRADVAGSRSVRFSGVRVRRWRVLSDAPPAIRPKQPTSALHRSR